MSEPFRIYSGWDHRQAEAAEVFRFSVEQNASIPVEVRFLKLDELPIKRSGVTSFTYGRFLAPYLCGFEGRAVFGDGCDQLCLGDVAELAEFDLQDRAIGVVKHRSLPSQPGMRARSWASLMLMDCAKLSHWTPRFVETAGDGQLMRLSDFADDAIASLTPEWNVLMALGDAQESPHLDAPKVLHWSYLSYPDGGSWIDRSGSALWAELRERWRAAR